MRTSAVSAGTLMSLGDFLAQTVIERRSVNEYEPKRTLRFFTFGICFVGPACSLWYTFLARRFGAAKFSTVKMVACDQLLYAPPFLASFLTGMELLKGEFSPQHIKYKLQQDYPDVLKTNYKIWPLVQAVNFTFVPVIYRVVVVNIVAVGWNTYLAMMSEKKHPEEPQHHPVRAATED